VLVFEVELEVLRNRSREHDARYGKGDLDALHFTPRPNRWAIYENVEGGECVEGMRMWRSLDIRFL
jgi:hypothetical protein